MLAKHVFLIILVFLVIKFQFEALIRNHWYFDIEGRKVECVDFRVLCDGLLFLVGLQFSVFSLRRVKSLNSFKPVF